MTDFKKTMPQIKVITKSKRSVKKATNKSDVLDNIDEKQVLCTIKKILEQELNTTDAVMEEFKTHKNELTTELNYYENSIIAAKQDSTIMKNVIGRLSSENMKLKE